MRKLRLNKLLMILFVIIVILALLFLYFSYNFKGLVINKYTKESNLQGINIKSNHLLIKYWRGQREFLVIDESDFQEIEGGTIYSFKKRIGVDWVEIK